MRSFTVELIEKKHFRITDEHGKVILDERYSRVIHHIKQLMKEMTKK